MNRQLLLCLLAIFLFSACKRESAPTTASAAPQTVDNVTVQNLAFDNLSARGSLTVEDKGQSTTTGFALRMRRDSVIWVSILPGLGIEAARLKMTQDSVYIMNRLQKEYIATNYRFLSERFKVSLSYDVLQAILIGNYQPNGAEKSIEEGSFQHIQQLRDQLLFDYFIGKDNLKLQQLHVQDQETGNNIVVKYNNFQKLGEVPFAYALAAQVLQAGQVSLFNMTQSRVSVTDEALEFPFAVPSDYKRL